MQSIPKFLRSEPSPRVQDSAFPPFKVEHRYRGVYERAGFDVYKGDGRRSNNSTPRTRAGSTFSSNSSVVSPNNPLYIGSAGGASKHMVPKANKSQQSFNPYETATSFGTKNKSHGDLYTKPSPDQDEPYQNRSASQPDASKHYQSAENLGTMRVEYPPTTTTPVVDYGDDSIPARSAERTLNINQLINKSNSSFNFSPSIGKTKNYMGLSLNLSNDPVDLGPLSDDLETSKSNFDSYGNEQYTNATSIRASEEMISQSASIQTDELLDTPERRRKMKQQQTGLPTPPKSTGEALDDSLVRRERLSTALTGIQDDYHQQNGPNPEFVVEEPRLSYSQQVPKSQQDVADQFDEFKQANGQTSNHLNLDYQNFLAGNTENPARNSQLSMVSSIISKESRYSDDEDNDVQQELERQLQNLKSGGSLELLNSKTTKNATPYPDEFPEDQRLDTSDIDNTIEQVNRISPVSLEHDEQVPLFNVEPSTPKDTSEAKFHTESPTQEYSSSIDSIQPLSVRHSKTKNSFVLPDIVNTPKVEQNEVDEINAKEEASLNPQVNLISNNLNEIKLNKKEIPEFKYPAGSGPCRACKQKINPDGKGPKKAIYSKTGELTGQWHRECFKCANKDCDVCFSKSVQCYVLDDEAYCNHHYHILNRSLCEMCQVGIEGECIENEVEQKWHLHCLRCFHCNQTINSDYYLINDAIYCDYDAINIISGQATYNDGYGNSRNGLTTNDKVEKRRTRLMHIDQY